MSNAAAFEELANIRFRLGELAGDRVRTELYKAVAHETVALISDSFEKQQSPYHIAWRPRRRSYPWPILRKSGRLLRSLLKFRITRGGFSVTSNLPYTNTHQYGRPQGSGRIPARPFMPEPRTSPVLPDGWKRAYDAAASDVLAPYLKK